MKKTIAIVAGGDSSEHAVSLKSAAGIKTFLDPALYKSYTVSITRKGWFVHLSDEETAPIDKNNFSFKTSSGNTIIFDFAIITIHGTPGEDGLLQGYFDLLGLPYSCSGTLASALSFNKYICNNYLRGFGINVADSVCLQKNEAVDAAALIRRIGLPLFVKPNTGGSSFGVTKVKDAAQFAAALQQAFAESPEVLIEQSIKGTEVTCGCYKTKLKTVVFPITEVVTHNEIFDFDAKYNGQSEEITPARIPDSIAGEIVETTAAVYDILRAKGLIRIDYIINDSDSRPVLLDVNTTPGMTPTSFIPQQIRAAGLDIKNVFTDIIENELN
ncbi:MAG: D-alanine--D-alanine ligase [Tannerellaceae bacterium]|jgi:D-alanine-D-alanine ligase|nr:D-alanine--D-alanine ligase [Tannerellaceae bacterium]